MYTGYVVHLCLGGICKGLSKYIARGHCAWPCLPTRRRTAVATAKVLNKVEKRGADDDRRESRGLLVHPNVVSVRSEVMQWGERGGGKRKPDLPEAFTYTHWFPLPHNPNVTRTAPHGHTATWVFHSLWGGLEVARGPC